MKTEQELKREAGVQLRNGDRLLAAELSAAQKAVLERMNKKRWG